MKKTKIHIFTILPIKGTKIHNIKCFLEILYLRHEGNIVIFTYNEKIPFLLKILFSCCVQTVKEFLCWEIWGHPTVNSLKGFSGKKGGGEVLLTPPPPTVRVNTVGIF